MQPVIHGQPTGQPRRRRQRRPQASPQAAAVVDQRHLGTAIPYGAQGPALPGETPWYENLAGAAGTLLGKAGAAGIKAMVGGGDYTVQTNSLLAQETGGDIGNEIPMMINSKVSNIIRHREYIGDVYGSTSAWNPTFFEINPGLEETLPWLFPVANCYTAYRIRGMIFMFKSLASEYSTTTYLGYVAMGSQYNSLEIDFPDKKTLENSEYANSTKPSKDCIHPIECAPGQLPLTELYVRNSNVPTDADQRLYDLARFCIATGGQQSNGIIGELWCSYEIEFYQPKMASSSGILVQSDHFIGTGVAAATPFGTSRQRVDGSTLLCSIDAETINFPATVTSGRYLVLYAVTGTGGATVVHPVLTVSNCTLISWWNAGAAANVTCPQNSLGPCFRMSTCFVIDITGKIAGFEFGGAGVYPTGTVNFDLVITQIPSHLEPGPALTKLAQKQLKGLKSSQGCVKDGKLRDLLLQKDKSIIESGEMSLLEPSNFSTRKHQQKLKVGNWSEVQDCDSFSQESFDEEEYLKWKYFNKQKSMSQQKPPTSL